jgi:2-dehydro-3-deoxyphosphogluconate aldolase / (4S)-4-hydroxy-2-oxoglutarate aldolase
MKLAEVVPQHKLMPLLLPESVAQVVEDASIYRDAGFPYVEIVCRSDCAIEALAQTRRQMPDLYVGAGTVLDLDTAEAALKADAKFLVSPGADPVIMDFAKKHNLEMIPGVLSPTEVAIGLRYGFTIQKLFPAEPEGLDYLSALGSPYTHTGVRMVCGHKIVKENAPAYLKHPMVAAIIADWLVPLHGAALRDELAVTRAWMKSL